MKTSALVFAFCASVVAASVRSDDKSWSRTPNPVAMASARHEAAREQFLDTGATYHPSPEYWPDHTIYQIMVDRFNNGNLSNDAYNLPPQQVAANEANSSANVWMWRHGGDLQGIEDRLDYLVDLGVTTLWITPVLRMDGSYHGYCTADLTEIDPGFGTEAEYASLVREAHARGMYVVQDIVINHLCDPIHATTYSKQPVHSECPDALSGPFWSGSDVNANASSQGLFAFSDAFFSPFKRQDFFNRCGPDTTAEIAGEEAAAVFGDFTEFMLDYDTRSKELQAAFTEYMKYWVAAADIDGFRLDAAKHVTEDFLSYFSTEMRNYTASQLNKTNFFIIGEVAATPEWIGRRLGRQFMNPTDPVGEHGHVPVGLIDRAVQLMSTYLADNVAPYPGPTAVYDFDESGTSRSVLQRAKASNQLQAYFSSTYYNTIVGQNTYQFSWTLLEIHDWVRFASADPTNTDKVLAGLAYLLSGPGTPIVYYGLEQGFNGRCAADSVFAGNLTSEIETFCDTQFDSDDSFKRQDMFVGGPWRLASTLASMTDLAHVGRVPQTLSPPWQEDPMLNRTTPTYVQTRRMIHLRNSCRPLRRGSTHMTWVEETVGGVMAFNRNDGESEMVVIVNLGTSFIDISAMRFYLNKAQTPTSGTVYANTLFTNQTAFSKVGSDGNMYLHPTDGLEIGPGSAVIFAVESTLLPWDEALGVRLCHTP